MTQITKEVLLANGWHEEKTPITDTMDYVEYCLDDYSTDKNGIKLGYHLRANNWTNMIGRDWYVHVDNGDFQTIGGFSFSTAEQLNGFLKLMDIDHEIRC